MIHYDVECVYVIRPEPEPRDRSDVFLGEPLIDVYDWDPYIMDPTVLEPRPPHPAATVKLSAARRTALNWRVSAQR